MDRPGLDWKGTGAYPWKDKWQGKVIFIVVKTKDGEKAVPAILLREISEASGDAKHF